MEAADYSFAVEYHGPPLAYEIPRAIPIEIERIPVADMAPPSSSSSTSSPASALVPVVQPLPSPLQKAGPADAASPTSVIENHAVMDGPDGDAGSSGLLCSSYCPDRSAELTEEGVESSGPVGSSVPGRASTESELSSEFDFRSSGDEEALATQGKKAMLVTFRDSARSSESASPATKFHHEKRGETETRASKGACYRCSKGSWLTEKEACLACDAKYCSACVLRAMGSMPEGRKCVSCIGHPVLESKRERLGRSSRMLRRLLSSLEVEQVMMAERKCEANQLRPEDIYVNGENLSSEELVLLLSCPCPPHNLKPGFYWYDKVSGYWGKEGHKPQRVITPDLSVGGTLVQGASNGTTGVLINGREITKAELQMLKLAGVQCAGKPHFWVDADGTYLEEGQKAVKGKIWDKPVVKLLSPVLSLPTPTKASNPCRDEVVGIVNGVVPDYLEQRSIQKMMLVGYHGSGTSTIFKQVKFLYKSIPFSEEERQDIKLIIQSNIYNYLGILLEVREMFEEQSLAEKKRSLQCLPGTELDKDKATQYSIGARPKAFSDWLLKVMASGNLDDIFPASTREYAPLVEELWNDPAIQATYQRIKELQLLPEVASYFLERVVDLSRMEYEPSNMDILYAEGITPTNGVAFTDLYFSQPASHRHGIDTDQQETLLGYQLIRIHNKGLGENCRWLDMFDDVKIVIFCIAGSDYDEFYEDANGVIVNKMIESKMLFKNTVTHPAFEQMDFLLILNKFDLFEQKIETVPITLCDWFDDFNPLVSRNRPNSSSSHNVSMGATMAQMAFHYIAVKFKRLFYSLTARKLYVTTAKALDLSSVDAAVRYASEILKWEEEKPVFGSSETIYSTEPSSYSPH